MTEEESARLAAATRLLEAINENERLTSGLRELAEKWRQEADLRSATHTKETPGNWEQVGCINTLNRLRKDLLALLPEATKPSLATKEVPE